jgi:hypothetical protein
MMCTRGYILKKLFFGAMLLALVLAFPIPTIARVDVGISISLPPPVVFVSPPEVVIIPETNVYFVPDLDMEIFFYGGWWWRPWEGRWYRSRSYGSGWAYYRSVPSFYRGMPSSWRDDYREHRWKGHPWDHQRIPHQQVQRNWRNWEKNRHWEKKNTWGVQDLKPQMRSPQPSREVKTQPRPQPREVQPQRPKQQSRDVQPEHSQKQNREAAPQSREVQPKQSQQQHREAPQQTKPRQGKPEKGEDEKQDRK